VRRTWSSRAIECQSSLNRRLFIILHCALAGVVRCATLAFVRFNFWTLLAGLVFGVASSHAQLISRESFSGMSLGTVSGAGSDSFGWSDSGWNNAVTPYYQCVDPTPDLTYQFPASGRYIDGGDRALQITTAPEPTPGTNRAYRSIPAQNTTLHAGFLVRVAAIGSGTDAIEFNIGDAASAVGRVVFTPNLDGTGMNCALIAPNGFSWGAGPLLSVGQTTHLVVRLARTSNTLYKAQYWVNGIMSSAFDVDIPVASNAVLSRVEITSYSGDSGGPASTVLVDEINVGYRYDDVLPVAPPLQEVASLEIKPAVQVRWLSQAGASYQAQKSYNLSDWSNLGSVRSGDGGPLDLLDGTDDSRAFYRVIIW